MSAHSRSVRKALCCYGLIVAAYVLAIVWFLVGVEGDALLDWAKPLFAALACLPFVLMILAASLLPSDVLTPTTPWVLFCVQIFLVALGSMVALAWKLL